MLRAHDINEYHTTSLKCWQKRASLISTEAALTSVMTVGVGWARGLLGVLGKLERAGSTPGDGGWLGKRGSRGAQGLYRVFGRAEMGSHVGRDGYRLN